MGSRELDRPLGIKPLFIGFGEAAQAFVSGWSRSGITGFSAYDIKTRLAEDVRDAKLADYRDHSVTGFEHIEDAVTGADVIFSLVTADQALDAARDVSRNIGASTLYLDCNSCAPKTKQNAAEFIEKQGASYLDVAVMAPVHPKLNRTPVLLSGKTAETVLSVLRGAGMQAALAGPSVGQASAIKLCRSIMVKGMEALMAECILSARSLGVEDAVLASLEASDPGYDWRERAGYAIDRMRFHGARRSAEMREAASMVAELSIPSRMSGSIAQWQQQIADLNYVDTAPDATQLYDEIANRISGKENKSEKTN
ncbi:MAG: DUF1932 domain-containing protein [Pseudomonadota bacterium]